MKPYTLLFLSIFLVGTVGIEPDLVREEENICVKECEQRGMSRSFVQGESCTCRDESGKEWSDSENLPEVELEPSEEVTPQDVYEELDE